MKGRLIAAPSLFARDSWETTARSGTEPLSAAVPPSDVAIAVAQLGPGKIPLIFSRPES
jgi:hypothetical protein